jgi:hypothetical protein
VGVVVRRQGPVVAFVLRCVVGIVSDDGTAWCSGRAGLSSRVPGADLRCNSELHLSSVRVRASRCWVVASEGGGAID